MPDGDKDSVRQIYPKRYFSASPTWFKWNHLTAKDVHELREERGFEGQGIYFHLNHPIQFIRLVGLIVSIELAPGAGASKYCLLQLDDSSGECIEIKIEREQRAATDAAEYPSNTKLDNVDVNVELGIPTVCVDKKPVDIGTVIKVKGKITQYRNERQLALERIWIVKDTNAEAECWAQTARWKEEVLAKPWVLTQAERAKIDEEIKRDQLKEKERAKRKRAYGAKYEEKKRRHDEKAERKRLKLEAYYDAGVIKGSGAISAPWD